MTWVKLANTMPSHPKTVLAGDRGAWLFVCGLCYSNEHLTDGFIATHVLPVAAPGVKSPERLAARLVTAKLWHVVTGGWMINDYGDYQRSSSSIREARAKDAARKAATRSNGSPHGQMSDSERSPSGVQSDPRGRDRGRSQEEKRGEQNREQQQHVSASPTQSDPVDPDVHRLSLLMSDRVRASRGVGAASKEALPVKSWHDACRSMIQIDGLTVQQIEFAIGWVCRHHYWSRRIRSMPRLRSEMEAVAADIRQQRAGNVVPLGRKQNASDLIRKLQESEAS